MSVSFFIYGTVNLLAELKVVKFRVHYSTMKTIWTFTSSRRQVRVAQIAET